VQLTQNVAYQVVNLLCLENNSLIQICLLKVRQVWASKILEFVQEWIFFMFFFWHFQFLKSNYGPGNASLVIKS
jgi:hypothetical protein